MLDRFTSLFRASRKSQLTAPSPELFALFGGLPSAAGIAVTPDSAMRCAVVFACVKIIAESVAQLPLHLYERLDGGGKERARNHPLASILGEAANEWTSSFDFRLQMQTALCLHGNAFAYINRSGGKITELIQIPSSLVTVETDATTLEPHYRVSDGKGAHRIYDRSEVFHLKTIGTAPNAGLSPIDLMRDAIGLALAMERHASKIFSSGARPGGVLKYAKTLGKDTLERLRDSFNSAHAGGENAGKTLVLEDGMDFVQNQFSSVDLQFLEMRRHQIAEIARGFRIPLHMLQELERATHNNAESMGQQFISLTLLPQLKSWEGAISRSLLDADERKTFYAEFLTDDLARADLAQRFTAYSQAVTNGLLSPNEIRAAENRAPYAGGDQFRMPLNTENAANGKPQV